MLQDNSLRFSARSQQVATEFSTAARRIQSLVRPPSLEIVPACFGGAFWGRLGDWDDSAAWIDPPPLAAMVEQSVACGRGRTIEVMGRSYAINMLAEDAAMVPGCGSPGRQVTLQVARQMMLPKVM